jgi:hypothetical protein
MQAAVVNAMIAAFIETPMDGESISEMFGGSSEDYMANPLSAKSGTDWNSLIL